MGTELTLRDLAMQSRAAREVLRGHRVDFCCQGHRAFAEICEESGLDARALLAEIESAAAREDSPEAWAERSMVELIEHLLKKHHEPLREEMPRLILLAESVEKKQTGHPLCPSGLADHLKQGLAAVEVHLDREEELFFPLLCGDEPSSYPMTELRREHEEHDERLQALRAMAHDFEPPPDAGKEWRDLYSSLDKLEADLMEHMHLENNILFEWFPSS
jgi:regulator of cell morphogenesis and NO signaling